MTLRTGQFDMLVLRAPRPVCVNVFPLAHALILIKDDRVLFNPFFVAQIAALVAHVQFRAGAVAQRAGRIFAALGVGKWQWPKCAGIGLAQRRLDAHLSSQIFALAQMVEADIALRIDQKFTRPTFVVEGLPDVIGVVEHHRMRDAKFGAGLLDLPTLAGKLELRRMHANRHQAVLLVLGCPLHHIRQGAYAVDAGVIPKIHQHHFAAHRAQGDRVAVDPAQTGREFGRVDGLWFEHG